MICKNCGEEIYGGKGDYWHTRWGNMECEGAPFLAYPSECGEVMAFGLLCNQPAGHVGGHVYTGAHFGERFHGEPVSPVIGSTYFDEEEQWVYSGAEQGWLKVVNGSCSCCGRPY